ncbi:BTB/POZ domain-containing protein At3g22104-like isoform X1 [Cucurbita pepo subsp. pepo]|uniref:BTB/POZ domain-containing protein At3g22104-like isoform X1 n=2 Tax=Cucurbita pepo subsp. pepo TaxID=3664 RepID=UPI000C9DA09D|nr:BTB/POZ domain-containing protein At3g22104-like isoform X1 [Cucurbita pepo subsp. pepo]
MEVCCNLEVDINGEEIFMVDKNTVASYSGRLSKLFGRSKANLRNLKLIFQDFPGGAEGFELILKFCYNNGYVQMSPSNVPVLYSAAQFMEMNCSISGTQNLQEQTERYLDDINEWTWSELLNALKRCQDLSLSRPSIVLHKCLDSLVGKLHLALEEHCCPSTSSSDGSALRFSCDTKSTESLKTVFSNGVWWFEELLLLNPDFVKMIVPSMLKRDFDEVVIARFLVYYQKSKISNASRDEKRKIIEVVVEMLYTLDHNSVSCKSLFSILRVALGLNINKCIRNKLEKMIGAQLDRGTLDNLLLPSRSGSSYLYDVNLVLRFVKAFLHEQKSRTSQMTLTRVATLMDLYMAEVAPDPCLKPSKFLALAKALPEYARRSHDDMYRAMDMYFEVHTEISEEERIKMCCALNYEKLSVEICINLSKNRRFPSKSSIQGLVSEQLKQTAKNSKSITSLPRKLDECENKSSKRDETSNRVMFDTKKLDFSDENERLKAHIQGIQWRVMELERVCKKMHTQMGKVMKSKVTSHSQLKSLPWLCS